MPRKSMVLLFAAALMLPVSIAATGCTDAPQANQMERPAIERDITERPPQNVTETGLIKEVDEDK